MKSLQIISSKIIVTAIALVLIFQQSCKKDDTDKTGIVTPIEYDTTSYKLRINHFPTPFLSADNKLTVQKVKLGKMLFYERKLSLDESISCSSCHQQKDAFSDIRRFSVGVEGLEGSRQAMAVFNMAWNTNEFFWDGRAHLLRDQSLMPIQDPLEMNEELENVINKLSATQLYQDQFTRAFGSKEITAEKLSLALEQFMFSIVSNRSKYDLFLQGNVALSKSEENGRKLFFADYNPFFPEESGADCAHCHSGINFFNNRYLNNGLDNEADITDFGREKATTNPQDRGKFKVTSLRNIELTPPYMHDGRFNTLLEVIDHYDHGIRGSKTLDPALRNTMQTGLMLSDQDKSDLIAFLKTLTDYELIKDEEYGDPFN